MCMDADLLRSESAGQFLRCACLLPNADHLHFLAEGTEPTSDLRHFIKSLKIKTSRQYAAQSRCVLWQKGFHEHILRATESIQAIAWYIWLNPVRKGLVAKPGDYPYLARFRDSSCLQRGVHLVGIHLEEKRGPIVERG